MQMISAICIFKLHFQDEVQIEYKVESNIVNMYQIHTYIQTQICICTHGNK